MKTCLLIVWLAAAVALAAGCTTPIPGQEMVPGAPDSKAAETPSATPTQGRSIEPPTVPAGAQALVDRAQAELARQIGDKAENSTLLSVEKQEFPDASLGVPEADKMYAQVITPGYVIRFGVGDKVYTYHGSGERVVLVPETQSSNVLANDLYSPDDVDSPDGLVPPAAELERALGDRMLNDPGALCEWEVWGRGERVLYMWAVCESASGSAVSAPAVAYLDGQGRVAAVNMPGDGTYYGPDVRRLFPPQVQERIFAHEYDARAAMERINKRRLASR